MVKGEIRLVKPRKRVYGFRRKARRLGTFSLREVLEAMLNPAVRIFRQGMGYDYGVEKIGPKNVPWAGATAGAKDKADAIAKVRAISPGVADRMTDFSMKAEGKRGTRGVTLVENLITGERAVMSRLALDLHVATGKALLKDLGSAALKAERRIRVYAK